MKTDPDACIVLDSEDVPKIVRLKWRLDAHGNVIASIPKAKSSPRVVVISRIILGIKNGDSNRIIKFKNKNKCDLRKSNLIITDRAWQHKLLDTECECGCGCKIRPYNRSGMPLRFKLGHHKKYKTKIDKINAAKACRKLRMESYRNKSRSVKKLVIEFFGNVCKFCGFSYNGKNASSFEFDHITPETKEKDISKETRHCNFDSIATELTKCRMLCANCHNIRHGGRW